MRIANIGVAGLVLVLAVTVNAQTTRTLQPGARIRVTAPGALTPEQRAGRLIAVREDSLRLQPDGAAEVTIPRSAIREVDTSRGRHTATGRGAVIGALTGAAAGAALGAATWQQGSWSLFSRGQAAMGIGAAGGLVGLVVGGLVGHAHSTEEWKPLGGFAGSLMCFVPIHVAINPVRGGEELSIHMRM